MFGTSLKWAWKVKSMQSSFPRRRQRPTQSLRPSAGHPKALHYFPWGHGALSEQHPCEQTPWVLCQAGQVFQGFELPEKKCWCLETFKFGFGPPYFFHKSIIQAEKGQAKMVLCLLPFFFFFFPLFFGGVLLTSFWATTLLTYFNFASSLLFSPCSFTAVFLPFLPTWNVNLIDPVNGISSVGCSSRPATGKNAIGLGKLSPMIRNAVCCS